MEDWVDNARMIVDSSAAIVPQDGSLARVRAQRYAAPGFSAEVMAQMGELGWLQLCVPEDAGGAGLGMRECVSLMIALGHGLVPEPVVGALLAQRVLAGQLPEAALGGEAVTVAVLGATLDSIDPPEAGESLTGERPAVPGAPGAAYFAVLAPGAAALIPADAPGLKIAPVPRQDGGFDGTLTFDGTPAEWHSADTARAIDEAILAQSAYLLGTAERGIEMTLDYLRIRKQFGRPIGSFQSLQHRATDTEDQPGTLPRRPLRHGWAHRYRHRPPAARRSRVARKGAGGRAGAAHGARGGADARRDRHHRRGRHRPCCPQGDDRREPLRLGPAAPPAPLRRQRKERGMTLNAGIPDRQLPDFEAMSDDDFRAARPRLRRDALSRHSALRPAPAALGRGPSPGTWRCRASGWICPDLAARLGRHGPVRRQAPDPDRGVRTLRLPPACTTSARLCWGRCC